MNLLFSIEKHLKEKIYCQYKNNHEKKKTNLNII